MMTKSTDDTHESIDDADFNTSSSSAATSSGNSECKKRKFVPIHESSRNVAKRLDLQKSLDKINDELANDSTKELISLFKEESNRQQQREDRFMTLIERMLTPTPVSVPQPQFHWNSENMYHHQARYGVSHQLLRQNNLNNTDSDTIFEDL